ncbi:MAG: ABC transporter permease [Eubacteriales bacterium]|mgnify:CR=1 FL=1|nr:ABC transporter permease [bacterium]MDY2792605.1 ABC transporter permease [Eubacteriales bacterium]
MLKYTVKRLLQSMITVLLVVSVVFLLFCMLPTDYYFTEEELMKFTEEQKEDKLQAAGLLDPPLVQLGRYLKNIVTKLDLGVSRRVQANQPVTTIIGKKFGVSMKLGLISLGISLILGVSLGVLQARYKDGFFDHIGTGYTVFVNAVPHLVTYSLILAFGARILKLPSMYSVRNPGPSSILPIVCLSVGSTAGYMLWIRRYMVDELNKDYIRLAKLKGLSTRKVMYRHVLKNAFVPLAQYLPYSILLTVGGSLLVERFFSVPGMGPLLTDAIARYDVNLSLAIVLLYATMGILGLFLGDVLMTIIDPRIRLDSKGGTR